MNRKEKALLLVPHQDDDIILLGNIFNIITSKYELFIVFSSLDKDPRKGDIRKKEACKGCSIFGITSDHIMFLGYPDNFPHTGKHFFMEGDKTIISVLKNLIKNLNPSIIFSVDYDKHWDHKMLSLAFEEAMGILLKENPSYRPLVMKGFCYETGCLGLSDYKASKPESIQVQGEIHSNRSLEWENRISIYGNCKPGFIWNTQVYKALSQHKSQSIKLFASSIINADNVFWIRRTDNLLLQAAISSDFGDVSKLNDFMIIDTYDIETSDIDKVDFSKGVWKGKEKKSEIKVFWNEKVRFDRVIFHGNPNQKVDQKIKITIYINGTEKIGLLNTLRAYGRNSELRFDTIYTDKLVFILEADNAPIELSEIEVLFGEYNLGILHENTIQPDNSDIKGNKVIDLLNNCGCRFIYYNERIIQKLHSLHNNNDQT